MNIEQLLTDYVMLQTQVTELETRKKKLLNDIAHYNPTFMMNRQEDFTAQLCGPLDASITWEGYWMADSQAIKAIAKNVTKDNPWGHFGKRNLKRIVKTNIAKA